MSVRMQQELEHLKRSLLSLCGVVEGQVQEAVRALQDRDLAAAEQIARRDSEVNRREVEIEEDCLRLLALYQPVAIDLRWIVSVMKINNDLERIGDLAVNIAHKVDALAAGAPPALSGQLTDMAGKTQRMLRDALDALVNLDSRLAQNVCERDDEVDEIKHQMRVEAEQLIQADPQKTRPCLRMLAVSRNLERIADSATNICEDVIYMAEGRIIRHGENKAE